MQLSPVSFWENHSVWFLIGMAIFPRITMLVATSFGYGFFYWCGWVFVPRFTAAIIATLLYWETNPFLLIFVWIMALGDVKEKQIIATRK